MDKSISMKILIIMMCITAFFFNAMGNGYVMLILCLIPVMLRALILITRVELNSSAALMLFILFAYMSSTFSASRADSNKFIFMMIAFLIMKFVLEDSFGWQKFFSTTLFFIVAVSVAVTLLSVVVPDMVLGMAEMLFDGESFDIYSLLFYEGSFAGLYGQTGINAYVISMFLAFVVASLFLGNKNKLNYVLLGVGIIALLLTKKRSFLLANVIATLVLFIQNSKSEKRKLKIAGRLLFLVVAAFLVVRYVPATQGIVEKISALENAGDITNGRETSWEQTIEIWKENPIFGIGINNMVGIHDISTHNVYIQLLAETGIFGAIAYIILLWSSFTRSGEAYQYILKDDELITNGKIIYGVSIYMQMIFIVYSFFGNPVYGINFMLPYIMFVSVMDSYRKYKRSVME